MKPFTWALLSAVVWGCAPIIEKLGLTKVPVWTGLLYRCIGVLLGFVILILFRLNDFKQAVTQPISGWHYLVIGGFLASIVGQIFYYNALKIGEVSKITPIGAMYPLFSFILGILILKEKLTLAKAGGVLFIILGAVLLK